MPQQTVPRIESLSVKNYRALQDVELKEITPLSAFLGANGSGKSTLFDVFVFLAECFRSGCAVHGTKEDVLRNYGHVGVAGQLNSS